MTENNQNQQLLQIIQDNQKSSRLNTIAIAIGTFSTLTTVITSGILIWKSFKKDKPSLAKRRLRIKAALARLNLELENLEKEAQHESELAAFEVGLKKQEELTNNLLNNLKNKGEKLIKDQTTKIKDKIND